MSFHTRTTQLPFEVDCLIIRYAESDTPLPSHPIVCYPPIAYVLSTLRDAYLGHLNCQSCVDFGIGKRPVPRIGEALNFPDLQTLARFFTNGSGRPGQYLAHVTYIRIVYRDDWAVSSWEYDVRYAYKAEGIYCILFSPNNQIPGVFTDRLSIHKLVNPGLSWGFSPHKRDNDNEDTGQD